MTDDIQTLEPPAPTPADQTAGPDAADEQQGRLRDRVLGLRAVAAVALASLILGGAGGLALGAISNGADGSTGPGGRGGPGGNFAPGQLPGQQGQLPGGIQQGQLPGGTQQGGPGVAPPAGGLAPGTVPQDDVQPDDSTGTSTGQNT